MNTLIIFHAWCMPCPLKYNSLLAKGEHLSEKAYVRDIEDEGTLVSITIILTMSTPHPSPCTWKKGNTSFELVYDVDYLGALPEPRNNCLSSARRFGTLSQLTNYRP
jgi:hypothetical protein